jgi:DNA-binding response OmpR family regulator
MTGRRRSIGRRDIWNGAGRGGGRRGHGRHDGDDARGGRSIELARKEFAVLETLMAAQGATVSAEELLEQVWDEHADPFTNVVRMTIITLRRKLG